MDFAAVARSMGREEAEKFKGSAAAVVGKVKPSTLLDRTSGRVAEAARDSAAAVVDLLRSAGSRKGETDVGQVLDAGLLAVRAQLTRGAVHSQVFQSQLILALRHEEFLYCEERDAGIGEPALALYWRLHASGLLPFSKMLEATEALPSLALGHRRGGEGQRQCGEDTIVSGMRALALRSARRAGDADSPQGDGAVIVSGIAKHLFDVAYRTPSPGSEPIASRAAKAVLDQLCCGQGMFGHNTNSRVEGAEARLRGCLSVLVAILQDGADDSTAAFLKQQLRLLIENSSGQRAHVHGKEDSIFDTEMAADDRGNEHLLVQILQHFPSAQCAEVLLSICRRAVARAADTTGLHLHKPILRWETFGPVVRAAATAHREIPARIASIGIEMAEAAVNFVPSGDATTSRTIGCNQQQGVLVLSAAFRLVAQADVASQGASRGTGGGGLYAQWFTNCFGPLGEGVASRGVEQAEVRPASPGFGQEKQTPEPHGAGSQLSGSEAVREAMEKQRATEIMLEALCLSVPYDPAFVLEVHKDVLKSRLRKAFSVQVRDYLDLCVTRLADLKGQEETGRCNENEKGHDRTPGVGKSANRDTGHVDGDCGDPTTREVGFFLRQFKLTGEVPLALKTAILWHPKSWASFRKVLLAPPAERIAMPDGSGKMLPAGAVMSETIGRSENGLRVEISLKYRRLLVQKLAKESLLSAKDHESFRKSYVEFLQHQRDQDKQSESPDTAAPASAVARQLLLLESRLGQLQKGNGIEERLGLLLQEYLPCALVVDLCIEDDAKPPDRDWFARVIQLLSRVLEEWKRRVRGGESASPEEVAEAILNSVHCCVAAVGASLPLPRQSCQGNGDAHSDAPSGVSGLPAPLDPPVAQAFRRFGEVVTTTAGADHSVGEAIFGRCSSLLASPSARLDAKQVLSLVHVLAALPPAFYPKVGSFWTGLVTKILRPLSTAYAGLAATAQVGALFLQSTLLLRERDWKSMTGGSEDADPDGDERGSSETRSHPENKSGGFASVALLDFCWWMERRLSIAKQSANTTWEPRNESRLAVENVGLLRLLRSVVKHPLIKLALRQACRARGSTTPPLKLLIALEMAVSSEEGFGGGSIKFAFLDSVTLGRLVLSPTGDAESLREGSFSTEGEELVQPNGKRGAASVEEVWKELVAVLFGEPRLLDACRARVCRDATPNESADGGGVGSEQADRAWQSHCHSSWRGVGDRHSSHSEGTQGVLDAMLQVMGKLCSLEATAGSMCENPLSPAGLDGTDGAVVSEGCSRRRKVSLLLTEALALVTRLRVDADASALVLIAEMAIPAIGAAEGRGKAIASLRVMEEYFCKARPLEFGAIVRLMRVALMWCGNRTEAKPQGARHESCPVTRMLEELPMLTAEMVRVWPRLSRTLQPVIGSPASTGPYARGGWAFRLNTLHSVGGKLVRDLADGWASSSDIPTRGAVSSAASTKKVGRIPLGPVNNRSTHAPKKRGEVAAQKRDPSSNGPQGARDTFGATESCNDQLRDASAALPRTFAQVVVGTIQVAATCDLHANGSREVPSSKRSKTSAGLGATGHGKQPVVIAFQPPPHSTWVSNFLTPVYGPGDEAMTASSLGVLLSTLVTELGNRRVPCGGRGSGGEGGARIDVCEAIGGSLLVAILVLAPSLVARLAEPPCLTVSSSTTSAVERLGRSLAVLDGLKLLLEKVPARRNEKPGVWLTMVLSHYTAALLSISTGGPAVALPNGRDWSDVAAFVHEHVVRFSTQELGRLPAALRLAAKEVDPLLSQYL